MSSRAELDSKLAELVELKEAKVAELMELQASLESDAGGPAGPASDAGPASEVEAPAAERVVAEGKDAGPKLTGKCKWWSLQKGFGFIPYTVEGEAKGSDVFVHHTALHAGDFAAWRKIPLSSLLFTPMRRRAGQSQEMSRDQMDPM